MKKYYNNNTQYITKYNADGAKPNYAHSTHPYIPIPVEREHVEPVWPPVRNRVVTDTIGPAPKYFSYA